LQGDLDRLVDWVDKWQLRFNADICKVIHLDKNNEQQDYNMRRHGCNNSDDVNDIDNELKLSKHIESQINEANKQLGMIRCSFNFLDAEAMKQLFVAVVHPNLEFGNIAWSPKFEDKNLIECSKYR
jgi:hypothetical protein